MAEVLKILDYVFPDGIIYGLTAIIFLMGIFKCCRPVLRNAGLLRRARESLKEGAKVKLSRPVWSEPNFLGKKLQPTWRAYLQSAELGAANGIGSDVADYIHDDSIITDPGKASLADVIPGLCTSLGILGTFLGLSMGLSDLDVLDVSSIAQLTSGIAFAFNTSIVGIIASMLFNIIYRYAVGKARASLDSFVTTFYACGVAQPPDPTTQILAIEREQSAALAQFTEDMSARMGEEIQRAISVAMSPVQRSMHEFMDAATRAQVEGLDQVVTRFVERMNQILHDKLLALSQAMSETAEGQMHTQEKLHGIVASIGDLSQRVVEVHGISEQVIAKYAEYVTDMSKAYQKIGETQEEANDLLAEISDASTRQTKYLSALQEYQTKLQASFRDYTIWTDQFTGGLEERTAAQNASVERISAEMHASSEQLRGAYASFTEAIELGLANALGLFDENMQKLMRQVNTTLKEIQATMGELEGSHRRTSGARRG